MPRLVVHCFAVSIDGFGAGPRQDLANPLGVGGEALHEWMMVTRTFRSKVLGQQGGSTGIDDQAAARSFQGIGAWIMGRNMFGPVRGPWPDESWRGWWGENPPFHTPVFVLTHHARRPLEMEGGTTFHFVTGGIHEALQRARAAAGGLDVRVGGGVGTFRAYLRERLIDEARVVVSPVVMGSGENLWQGLDLPGLGYRCTEYVAGEKAAHFAIVRR